MRAARRDLLDHRIAHSLVCQGHGCRIQAYRSRVASLAGLHKIPGANALRASRLSARSGPINCSEALSRGDEDLSRCATDAADLVMGNATGRQLLARAYSVLFALAHWHAGAAG